MSKCCATCGVQGALTHGICAHCRMQMIDGLPLHRSHTDPTVCEHFGHNWVGMSCPGCGMYNAKGAQFNQPRRRQDNEQATIKTARVALLVAWRQDELRTLERPWDYGDGVERAERRKKEIEDELVLRYKAILHPDPTTWVTHIAALPHSALRQFTDADVTALRAIHPSASTCLADRREVYFDRERRDIAERGRHERERKEQEAAALAERERAAAEERHAKERAAAAERAERQRLADLAAEEERRALAERCKVYQPDTSGRRTRFSNI